MGSGSVGNDDDLRDVLRILSPSACEHLRDVLIRDQADRDAIASRLMRYRDKNGQDWADLIDLLTMYPDARRRVARLPQAAHPRPSGRSHRAGPVSAGDGLPVGRGRGSDAASLRP
jgi:hypothetical protein